MKKRQKISILLGILLGLSLWFSCRPGRKTAALTPTAENSYRNFCAGCHGEKMDAFVDRKFKHGDAVDSLVRGIKKGYPDEGMPGFEAAFTDTQSRDLAQYIVGGIKRLQTYDYRNIRMQSDTFRGTSMTVRLDTVAKGLTVPWSMAFLPGGDMLVSERSGSLYRVDRQQQLHKIAGVPPVVAEGQGGLMDIALHPSFESNGYLYLSYALPKKTDSGMLSTTAVLRARLEGDRLAATENIFTALPFSRTRHHYGGRLLFGKDGLLYITVGERGNEKQNPQNLHNALGKIHRVKDDGSIPSDNPFLGTKDAVPSIYSYGHRNPQGIALHPVTGDIWSNEHGPRGGDEINIVRKGKNYGWPVISFGINYNGVPITSLTAKKGMEQPLLYWIPSIAPSGMTFVTGTRYRDWEGSLLNGSLRFRYLNRCRLRQDKIKKEENLLKNIGRLRDVRMGPDGYIYVAVESPGFVFRLMPLPNEGLQH